MMQHVLSLLEKKLNEYFNIKAGENGEYVRLLETMDSLSFPANTVTPYLINIAEDRVYRKADRYQQVNLEGRSYPVKPQINLTLQVLFVAKFKTYTESLKFLSYIIRYFQNNPYFDPLNAPELADHGIEKLLVELVTLPLGEQNEVWNALHTSYLPSVLYKISGLTYAADGAPWQAGKNDVRETGQRVNNPNKILGQTEPEKTSTDTKS